jgi:LPXTG-motif cell wall-anchored protein/uncharacterized repeat protein (TIGR01451 family)
VINTGNQTLSDVVVTDPLLGGPVCNVDLDAGQLTNRAAVVGKSPNQQPLHATSNEVVVPGIFRPELTLVKSTSTTTFDAPGVKIPFRFTIINTGNVTLDNVKVTDPRIANVSCPKASLPMGEQMTCEATYTTSQADLDAGQLVNRAAGHGDVPAGAPQLKPVPSNEAIVPGEQRPGLSMVKSPDVDEVTAVGQNVRYRFAVTNTGNTTLQNIAVTDAKVPRVACPTTVLAPGGSTTCTATYTVTRADIEAGRLTNVATATGSVPGRPPLPPVTSNQVEIRVTVPPTTTTAQPGMRGPTGTVPAAGTPAPDATVLSATTSNPDSKLPRTGRNATALALAAVGLAAIGASIMLATRRRNTMGPELPKPYRNAK